MEPQPFKSEAEAEAAYYQKASVAETAEPEPEAAEAEEGSLGQIHGIHFMGRNFTAEDLQGAPKEMIDMLLQGEHGLIGQVVNLDCKLHLSLRPSFRPFVHRADPMTNRDFVFHFKILQMSIDLDIEI